MNNILAVIAFILDQPALQGPGSEFVAAFLKKELPAAIDKDLGDFLVLVGQKINGTVPPPVGP